MANGIVVILGLELPDFGTSYAVPLKNTKSH
jgi:hypothetical protein